MVKLRKILLVCAMFAFVVANTQTIDDTINESDMNKALSALIYGASCDDKSDTPKTQRVLIPIKNTINVLHNSTIDAKNYTDTKSRFLAFNGEVLRGGIYEQNLYMSADKKISYNLNGNTLEVKSVCQKQGFIINNFSNGDFGLNLSNNPTKEVAIVLNVNNSMWRYTNALKDIAPYLAKHILGEYSHKGGQYAKISLITFSYVRITDLGTFYDGLEFANALNSAKGTDSKDNIINVALVEAMRNFTKDNGLKKEVYLITNGGADDPHKEEQMLAMTKNLNASITRNSKEKFDNRVKIHIFALKPFSSLKSAKANAEFLQNLAKITGGTYNEANNAYDFKKQILSLSNGGKPFDMGELNNEIRPSKSNKIYNPDEPKDSTKK